MTELELLNETLHRSFGVKEWNEYRSASIEVAAIKQLSGEYGGALPMLIDVAIIDAMYMAEYTTGVDKGSISTPVQLNIIDCGRKGKFTSTQIKELVSLRAERIAALPKWRRGELSDVIEDLVFGNQDVE